MADAVSKMKKLAEKAKGARPPKESTPDITLPVETKSKAKVVQLPLWADQKRGFPNSFARSALFTVRWKRTKREQFKDHPIATLGDTIITYTGEELRQDDEDVFLQVLHLARQIPLGQPVVFSPYSLLKELGWPTSGQNHYKRLESCIKRLNANGLELHSKLDQYGGSLIRKFRYQDGSGKNLREWSVWLEPEIINLFQAVTYSQLEWQQRLSLKSPVGKWLQSFLVTHKQPYPLKVSTIHELCNSSNKTLASFRQSLDRALGELTAVGFLEKYWIDDNDLVHVRRA